VATEKHYKLEGRKLLLVQPLDLNRTPKGDEILSVEARSRS
jgi:microcompartment protein CcmK/EutM